MQPLFGVIISNLFENSLNRWPLTGPGVGGGAITGVGTYTLHLSLSVYPSIASVHISAQTLGSRKHSVSELKYENKTVVAFRRFGTIVKNSCMRSRITHGVP